MIKNKYNMSKKLIQIILTILLILFGIGSLTAFINGFPFTGIVCLILTMLAYISYKGSKHIY